MGMFDSGMFNIGQNKYDQQTDWGGISNYYKGSKEKPSQMFSQSPDTGQAVTQQQVMPVPEPAPNGLRGPGVNNPNTSSNLQVPMPGPVPGVPMPGPVPGVPMPGPVPGVPMPGPDIPTATDYARNESGLMGLSEADYQAAPPELKNVLKILTETNERDFNAWATANRTDGYSPMEHEIDFLKTIDPNITEEQMAAAFEYQKAHPVRYHETRDYGTNEGDGDGGVSGILQQLQHKYNPDALTTDMWNALRASNNQYDTSAEVVAAMAEKFDPTKSNNFSNYQNAVDNYQNIMDQLPALGEKYDTASKGYKNLADMYDDPQQLKRLQTALAGLQMDGSGLNNAYDRAASGMGKLAQLYNDPAQIAELERLAGGFNLNLNDVNNSYGQAAAGLSNLAGLFTDPTRVNELEKYRSGMDIDTGKIQNAYDAAASGLTNIAGGFKDPTRINQLENIVNNDYNFDPDRYRAQAQARIQADANDLANNTVSKLLNTGQLNSSAGQNYFAGTQAKYMMPTLSALEDKIQQYTMDYADKRFSGLKDISNIEQGQQRDYANTMAKALGMSVEGANKVFDAERQIANDMFNGTIDISTIEGKQKEQFARYMSDALNIDIDRANKILDTQKYMAEKKYDAGKDVITLTNEQKDKQAEYLAKQLNIGVDQAKSMLTIDQYNAEKQYKGAQDINSLQTAQRDKIASNLSKAWGLDIEGAQKIIDLATDLTGNQEVGYNNVLNMENSMNTSYSNMIKDALGIQAEGGRNLLADLGALMQGEIQWDEFRANYTKGDNTEGDDTGGGTTTTTTTNGFGSAANGISSVINDEYGQPWDTPLKQGDDYTVVKTKTSDGYELTYFDKANKEIAKASFKADDDLSEVAKSLWDQFDDGMKAVWRAAGLAPQETTGGETPGGGTAVADDKWFQQNLQRLPDERKKAQVGEYVDELWGNLSDTWQDTDVGGQTFRMKKIASPYNNLQYLLILPPGETDETMKDVILYNPDQTQAERGDSFWQSMRKHFGTFLNSKYNWGY